MCICVFRVHAHVMQCYVYIYTVRMCLFSILSGKVFVFCQYCCRSITLCLVAKENSQQSNLSSKHMMAGVSVKKTQVTTADLYTCKSSC